MAKEFWKSKTFWVNVVGVLAAWLTSLDAVIGTEATLTVWGVVNLLLRAITTEGVTL